MTIAPTHHNHQRRIDNHGSSITLTNYAEGTENNYGYEWDETTNSPYTILARSWERQAPTIVSDERDQGKEDVDRNFAIKANADGASEIRDGGGKGASRIEYNNETFYVLNKDTQENGLIILECRNE